ncbi:MAG: glycosyltransferase family 4 protein [Acidobacteria bacterium]|nr:glycosyltransferase family 4 protein [Acidobacteriota bacterium]
MQYFNLPDEPGGSRPYQFARAWTRAGHRVTVVTGAVNHKTMTVPEKYRGRAVTAEDVEGIRLLRVWSYSGARGAVRRRMVNFVSYALSAALFATLKGGGADVVYASSTPLTVGIPGWISAAVRRAPFVFELRDLWPQSAIVAGVLSARSRATRLAGALARFLYRRAARVVAVTRGIADGLVLEGVAREKIEFVPNGVDDWMVEAGEPAPPPRGAAFRIVYCGAHGRWNGLGQVLDAAALLRGEPIEFEFIGDGDEKQALARRAADERLDNVRFLGALPKREAFARLREASACIIVTWDHPFQRMVLANKIFDYLAAGRPVLVAAEGEMAQLVAEAGCGLVVPPERPERLAGAARQLAALAPERLHEMGLSGRRHILRNYRRDELATRLLASFGALRAGGPGRPAGDGESV